MSNILTAEEFLVEDNTPDDTTAMANLMVRFAQLHVEAALKAGQKHIDICYRDKEPWPDSILNAYPKELIK